MTTSTFRGLFLYFICGMASASAAPESTAIPMQISDWDGHGRQNFLAQAASAHEHKAWVLGEIHGTNEAQALALAMVAISLSKGPVILALEIPQRSQPSVDAFMASDGREAAVGALVSQDFWAGFSDGRSSLSMLRLIAAARHLKGTGVELRVLCFDPAKGEGAAARDAGMAKHIDEALTAAPESRAVVLVGNAHSRLISPKEASDGAANLVSALQTPAFVVNLFAARGAYWACLKEGCGPHLIKKGAPAQGLLEAEYSQLGVVGGHTYTRLVLPQFTPSFPANEALGTKKE